MGIIFGLCAAIFWGAGDFFARYVTHRIGTYRTLFYIQFAGLAGLSIYLLVTGELVRLLAHGTWQPWLWAVLAAILNIAASLALYHAFEVGTLSLVSPIAASYAAVTVILSFFSGEILTALQNCAIVLTLLGVIIVSTPFGRRGKEHRSLKQGGLQGVQWALLAAVCYGLTFWMLGFYVSPALGSVVPVWCIRLMTPCVLLFCAPLVKQPLTLPRGSVWWLILASGAIDTLGYIAYTTGMTTSGDISTVTLLSSLYSAVTVLLAYIFLRERLQRSQWFGIVIVFFGVALINA
jgi:Predicted membrane protein